MREPAHLTGGEIERIRRRQVRSKTDYRPIRLYPLIMVAGLFEEGSHSYLGGKLPDYNKIRAYGGHRPVTGSCSVAAVQCWLWIHPAGTDQMRALAEETARPRPRPQADDFAKCAIAEDTCKNCRSFRPAGQVADHPPRRDAIVRRTQRLKF